MKILITGGSSGLGLAIKKQLVNWFWPPQAGWDGKSPLTLIDWSYPEVDITKAASIKLAADTIDGPLDVLINCAGQNEINYLPALREDDWDRVMGVNAKGIYLVSQALLTMLQGGTILNIVSNASHVPMTGSLAYNASKGAAAIMTAQMARELKTTHDITVFAISPGKIAGTGMSKYIERRVLETRGWTPEYAKEYQLKALKAGEEINPDTLAEFIAFLLSTKERHKYLHGQDIPYGG